MVRQTLPDLCLVYLLDRTGISSNHPAVGALTQDRIAEAFAVTRANVSRAMGKLEARGFVRIGKVHVPGAGRLRVAYFLTDAGNRRAKEVRHRLEELRIQIVDFEGHTAQRPLFEAVAKLPRRTKLSDLLAAIEQGQLDLRRFADRQTRMHGGLNFDVSEAIVSPHFRGRTDALLRLDAFLREDAARVFLLLGLPGIGKTALASRWVDSLKGRVHVMWRRLRSTRSPRDLLEHLAAMLHAAGKPALSLSLQRPQGVKDDESVRILTRDLATVRALIVFDNLPQASPEVESIVAAICATPPGRTGAKVLLTGRQRPKFLRAEGTARGWVVELTLDDLTPSEAEDVLAALGVERSRWPEISARCGGHPLSLELASAQGITPDSVRRTCVELISEEALPGLSGADLEALSLAAILETPAPRELLGPPAAALLRRCLLRETHDGRLGIHDLVREAVIRGLSPEKLHRLHHRAAEVFARGSSATEWFAALRHYVAAGELRKAALVTSERGPSLIDAGLATGLVRVLDDLTPPSVRGQLSMRVHLLRGQALFALGQWSSAVRAYEMVAEARDPTVVAEGLLGRGKAEVQRRSRLALPLLIEARNRLERLGLLRMVAETEYWIGGVHEHAGRLDKAREAFERGRAIAFDVGDRRWEGLCTYGIGRCRSQAGDFEGAVSEERGALRQLEREGRGLDIAKVCAGLGGNLLELRRTEEAEVHLTRAVEEARAASGLSELASSLYNLAVVRRQQGRLQDMLALLDEAMPLYESLEQYDWAAQTAAWAAMCAWSLDLPEVADSHRDNAMRFLAKTKEPALRVRVLRSLARAAKLVGRMADARRYLERAIAEARAARLRQMVNKLDAERRAIA